MQAAPLLSGSERVDRVLLISPPSPSVLAAHEEIAAFGHVRPDPGPLRAAAGSTRLVHGDNDQYCPEGATTAYAALDLDADVIPHGGHLDPHSGYGTWPSVRAWCHNPTTRLTPR